MWEGILAMSAVAAIVLFTVVAVVVLDELTELPDIIREALRGRTGRKSLTVRVRELEARVVAAERKLARPAAPVVRAHAN
jgi:hypothetical protein